jgi:hypothetical protein
VIPSNFQPLTSNFYFLPNAAMRLLARWVSAIARASAASAGWGSAGKDRSIRTIA